MRLQQSEGLSTTSLSECRNQSSISWRKRHFKCFSVAARAWVELCVLLQHWDDKEQLGSKAEVKRALNAALWWPIKWALMTTHQAGGSDCTHLLGSRNKHKGVEGFSQRNGLNNARLTMTASMGKLSYPELPLGVSAFHPEHSWKELSLHKQTKSASLSRSEREKCPSSWEKMQEI